MSKRGGSAFCAFLICLSSPILYANGHLKLTGNARMGHPIEFIQISAFIHSKCYPTPQEDVSANALLANQIKQIFHDFAKDPRDEVFVLGGFTYRSSVTQRESDGKTRIICEGYFQTNTISLKV